MQKIIKGNGLHASSRTKNHDSPEFFRSQRTLISAANELISLAGQCDNRREAGIIMKYAEAARSMAKSRIAGGLL